MQDADQSIARLKSIQECFALRVEQFNEFCRQLPLTAATLRKRGIEVTVASGESGVQVHYCGFEYQLLLAVRPTRDDARYRFVRVDPNTGALQDIASAYCSPEGVLVPVSVSDLQPIDELALPQDTIYGPSDIIHIFSNWLLAAAEQMPD